MNKLLKVIRDNRNRIIYMLGVVAVGCAAIYVGDLTVYRYGLIMRAYLGASVFYLAYMNFVKLEASNGFEVRFPRDLKYLAFAFVGGATLYWAGIQISDLIRFILKTI